MFWNMNLSFPTEFSTNKDATILPVSRAARFLQTPFLTHFFLSSSLPPLWDLVVARAGLWQVIAYMYGQKSRMLHNCMVQSSTCHISALETVLDIMFLIGNKSSISWTTWEEILNITDLHWKLSWICGTHTGRSPAYHIGCSTRYHISAGEEVLPFMDQHGKKS